MAWKPVKNYEGYYEVSDSGEVRSLDRIIADKNLKHRFLKGKVMKQSTSYNKERDCEEYYVVNLRKNGTMKVSQVHRLVAEAFIDNPDNLPTVNHKDGDKYNNNATNLEWASYSDNNQHALDNGLRSPRGNVVVQMSPDGEIITYYKSACEASRYTGIGRSSISHCLNHRASQAGGFIWRKVEECNDYLSNESTTEDELLLEVQERNNSEDIVYANGNI